MKDDGLIHLVKEIQAGNEQAFAELYERFYTSFYYMALKLTNNEADAQDAVQDAFVNIHQYIHSLKNPEVVIVWMKQILFNRCKNMFRKNRDVIMEESTLAALHIPEQKEAYIPELQMEQINHRDIVLFLLKKIPYLYREPLILKYYDEAKMEEIGQILGIPTGTVKSRLRTGKRLMRDEIKVFEQMTHEKVPFHSMPIGILLFVSFRKARISAPAFNAHSVFISGIGTKAILSGVVLCVSGVGASTIYQAYMREDALKRNSVVQADLNEQEAYFIVRERAHCKNDLERLSKQDLYDLQPYVKLLRERQGPFYALLSEEAWIQTYDLLTK